MASSLGHRTATGVKNVATFPNPVLAGGWVVPFVGDVLPSEQEYEAWHGFATGPGGYALVYIDDHGYGVLRNGAINEYSPTGSAMFLRKGQNVYFYWSTGAGTAPVVTLYFRQPEVGRL